MSEAFEHAFRLEGVRADEEDLEAFTPCLNRPIDVDGRLVLLRAGSLSRTLAHRDASIDAIVWGEPATATLTADGFGILLRAAVGTDRAQLLAKMSLELVIRGRVSKERELPSARADVPPIREVQELAIDSVEIRPADTGAPSLEELEQGQRARVHRYVSELNVSPAPSTVDAAGSGATPPPSPEEARGLAAEDPREARPAATPPGSSDVHGR